MRILLKFSTSNKFMPKDYRRAFISFFKKTLSNVADGKYYQSYYLSNQRRPFTFAVKLPKPNFLKDKIIIDKEEIQLVFSTGDSKVGFVFMSAFIAQKGKKFNLQFDNAITLTSVLQVNEKTVCSNSALIKMDSPLCLRQHNGEGNKDRYISIADQHFGENAKKIITEQLIVEGFSNNLVNDVEIVPVNAKKTVIFHYGCSIECSLGDFIINADKSIINYFLKYGIGSRKSSGFGCISLIAENN